MAAKQSIKYGVGAAVIALAIIALALVANPFLANSTTSTRLSSGVSNNPNAVAPGGNSPVAAQTGNFLVLLTDPPNVPVGTTQLNLTYGSVSIHVTYSNGTSKWITVASSGTVNLLALVNVTQTIGATSLPQGTTVDMLQFSVKSVSATVDGHVYPVTTLSSQLVVSLTGGKIQNSTSSTGALLDLSPTLIQVDATNSTGGAVSYYVLVPSATAIIKPNVNQGQQHVGDKAQLGESDKNELDAEQKASMGNVTITAAILSTTGNKTSFSVTIKNQGSANDTIFGLTLHGNFSVSSGPTRTCASTSSISTTTTKTSTTTVSTTSKSSSTTTSTTSHGKEGNPPGNNTTRTSHGEGQGRGEEECNSNDQQDHPDTIPFKINGTSLVPLFGDGSDHEGIGQVSSLTLKPGQSVTLTFAGVIGVKGDNSEHGQTILGAISGSSYIIRLEGEGSQTAQVTAT